MAGNWKKTRRIATTPIFEKKFYIFCEGTKTEPNYFRGIKKRIEKKAIYKNSIFVDIQGVGEGTLKIIDKAEQYVKKNCLKDAEVWIVYDKDDFSPDDFNKVAERASALNNNTDNIVYNVAWSNQCIEYWFILYFDYYTANNDRSQYITYLTEKFKSLKIGNYIKNDPDIFEKLETYGNSERAVKHAEKRLQELQNCSDAKKVPATKVHLLYQKLKVYF